MRMMINPSILYLNNALRTKPKLCVCDMFTAVPNKSIWNWFCKQKSGINKSGARDGCVLVEVVAWCMMQGA